MNLLTLSNEIPDKQSSDLFLQQRGVLHNPKICGNGHQMTLQLRDNGDRWRGRSRQCRTESGLRIGTWLEHSRLPYRHISLFIYCWAYEMTSIQFCERELLMDKNTVVDWNNFLREVCAADLLRNPMAIGGPNTTVEIDESLFSRRKSNQGRVLPQQWFFGGICRETRFIYAIPDRSAATLLPIIQNAILPGTTVMSDLWRAYGGNIAMGFNHFTVNHSINFVNPVAGAHTQNIENSWKLAKTRNKRQHGTNRQMLDSYLCEWMWPQKNRNDLLFDRIIDSIVAFMPPV